MSSFFRRFFSSGERARRGVAGGGSIETAPLEVPLAAESPKPLLSSAPSEFERLERILSASLEHPPALRQWFVEKHCGDDAQLRTLILNLLSLKPTSQPEVRGMADAGPAEVALGSNGYLGPVRLLEKVGQGGMGVVYRGMDIVLNRPVAVKLISTQRVGDWPDLDRFLKEARAAARVSHGKHENLTEIYFANVAGNVPFLVLEYVDGPSVAVLVKQMGRLPVAVAVEILKSICAGVAALHRENMVHRDIKPSNVLVGQDGIVRVTDFGLALSVAEPGGAQTPRTVAGTPQFMAPEMFEGEASMRSDVYAMGIMAFQLFTGRLPFTGSASELARSHRSERLPVAAFADIPVGAPMVELLLRATEKRPMLRYKSASEFARALEESASVAGIARGKPPLLRLVNGRAHESDEMESGATGAVLRPAKTVAELAASKRIRAQQEGVPERAAIERKQAREELVGTHQRCIRCRGDLFGTAVSGECPCCGLAVSLTELAAFCNAVQPGAPLNISFDLLCIGCKYDLRMLPIDGRCPSCARFNLETLRARLRSLSNQQLLEVLKRDLLIVSGILILLAALMLFGPLLPTMGEEKWLLLNWPLWFTHGVLAYAVWNTGILWSSSNVTIFTRADMERRRRERGDKEPGFWLATICCIVVAVATSLVTSPMAPLFTVAGAIFIWRARPQAFKAELNHNVLAMALLWLVLGGAFAVSLKQIDWMWLQALPAVVLMTVAGTALVRPAYLRGFLRSLDKNWFLLFLAVMAHLAGWLVEYKQSMAWAIVQQLIIYAAGILLVSLTRAQHAKPAVLGALAIVARVLVLVWIYRFAYTRTITAAEVIAPILVALILVCALRKRLVRPALAREGWIAVLLAVVSSAVVLLQPYIQVIVPQSAVNFERRSIVLQGIIFLWLATIFYRIRSNLRRISLVSRLPRPHDWKPSLAQSGGILLAIVAVALAPFIISHTGKNALSWASDQWSELGIRSICIISAWLWILVFVKLGLVKAWQWRRPIEGRVEGRFVQNLRNALLNLETPEAPYKAKEWPEVML